jgi:hypothetical protein
MSEESLQRVSAKPVKRLSITLTVVPRGMKYSSLGNGMRISYWWKSRSRR